MMPPAASPRRRAADGYASFITVARRCFHVTLRLMVPALTLMPRDDGCRSAMRWCARASDTVRYCRESSEAA